MSLEPAELIRSLGVERLDERVAENLRLAGALSSAGENEKARPFVARAFLLSRGARATLEPFERIHAALGDSPAIRAARKRVGLAAAAAGDASQAIADFNAWHYTDAELRGQDSYELDEEVLAAVRRLAEPFRQQPRFRTPPGGRALRVAHLLFGMTQHNSVLVRIARLFARFHDRARFETAFVVPESRGALASSGQGLGHVEYFEQQGSQVLLAPDQGTPAARMVGIAQAIRDFGADLLVMSAALADFHHYFVMSMTPAPVTVGFVSGPPAQFAPPELDHGISWTWHTLMDAPVPCSRVPLETDLPDPARLVLRSRESLGIPGDALLLASAGRHIKHRSVTHWRLVLELLRRHPAAHFLCLGATEDQVPEVTPLPDEFRQRVHFVPWMDSYLEVFGQADVVLDTFPSGGAVALTDVMALARPVVAFQNDYRRLFDQGDWSPAHEFLPECELVVPRGDEARYLEVVGRLITDPAYRRSLGLRCREAVLAGRGNPERMVRRCEAVFERVVHEKASSQLQPPLTSGASR